METKPIEAITKADIEAVREARRTYLQKPEEDQRIRAGVKHGEIGIEHMLATLRNLFNWAIAEGYVDYTPFKRKRRHGHQGQEWDGLPANTQT